MAQPKDFGFGADEVMLRDSVRRFLDENCPVDKLRKTVAASHQEAYESPVPPAPYDEKLWKEMVGLGWTALAVPERAGGAGMKMVAVAALAEEMGRHAAPSPLIATLNATFALREANTKEADAWLEKIAGGESATLAITNAAGSWDFEETDVSAKAQGDGAVLDGVASFVQDARKVSFFVVSARSKEGVGMYVVPADTPGVTIRPDRIVDLTRDQASVELSGVTVPKANVVAAAPNAPKALDKALPAILTVIAADMGGAGEWQLQTTAEYAKVRKQFDRQIGFFQAVKHPIVNMMLAVDDARSQALNAACAIDTEPDKAELYARMAKSSASDAAAFCSNRSVQLHGGIGFTWECDVQIWFKRQLHNQQLFGDGVYQRAKIAELL
jgi:alkylation response protein AidB-like acyl-CoA dehydrogenase